MAKNYKNIASSILDHIGGAANISSLVHCATRLRFSLKNQSAADIEAIKAIDGVLTVVVSGGQFQVIIGNEVPEVFASINLLINSNSPGLEKHASQPTDADKKTIMGRLVETISGIFAPTLGAMCGAGLIKGLIAILLMTKVLDETSGTYIILYALSDALFYFLPILLGYSAAKTFGGNVFVSMVLGGALIHPAIRDVVSAGDPKQFMMFNLTLIDYGSSVLPIIFAAYLSSHVERILNQILPAAIKNFVGPMLAILIVGPLVFLLIGPTADFSSFYLATKYQALYALNPTIGGAVIGALWQPLVIFGLHWGFIPIIINDYATVKTSFLDPMTQIAVMGQTGAAFGILVKMLLNRDTKNAGLTASSTVSGVFGVTEPIIYGLTLPRKSPFIMGIIGSAAGGAVAGTLGVKGYTFGALGIFFLASTIPEEGIGASFYAAVFGIITAFSISAILTILTYRHKKS
ncbi:PTS transporter subunit EIIC [Thorsellia anophelis]|uniref:PTS system, beta-glucosides-specific IIC component n=1 Tax=Thorsellia anophelis DSM 18579 TaxID=1123402 RepID=A0A1I0APA6_9GAMM|nr:PTS transporter subunit EIIC [Thorsellia anophelis]SES96137.1 PTS system, beta-glucosides-specific IIC component [Thorsellia anophelis DSM 18579]